MCGGTSKASQAATDAAAAASARADEALAAAQTASANTSAALASVNDSEAAQRAREAQLKKLADSGSYAAAFMQPVGSAPVAYKMLMGE